MNIEKIVIFFTAICILLLAIYHEYTIAKEKERNRINSERLEAFMEKRRAEKNKNLAE